MSDSGFQQSARQRRGIRHTVVFLLVLMGLFVLGFFHKITQPRVMSEIELRANGAVVFDNPRIIEPFRLQDDRSESFDIDNIKGKWTLMFFGFTHCPDICPTTMATLDKVVDNLDKGIAEKTQVVLVSVDPARDTPQKLAEYVAYFNPDFVGVTGDFLQIMQLTQNLNVAFQKVVQGDDYTVDHTGHLVIINPLGHYHAFIQPPFEVSRLTTVYQSIVKMFE